LWGASGWVCRVSAMARLWHTVAGCVGVGVPEDPLPNR
jgi:hypothetical protein